MTSGGRFTFCLKMRLDKQQQGDDNESGWTGGTQKERHCLLRTALSEAFLFFFASGRLEVWLTRSVDNWLLTEVCQSRLEKCDDLLSRVGLAAAARSYHIKQERILEQLYLGFRDYNF